MTGLSRRSLLSGAIASVVGLRTGVTPGQASPPHPADGPAPQIRIERFDAALDALIDRDAPVERIASGAFEWCEGPVWMGGAEGLLLASDPRANRIVQYRAGNGVSVWLEPSGLQTPADPAVYREPGSNGLAIGRGGLVCCDSGTRAIVAIDLATSERTVLADRFEGRRFNSPNDLVVSPRTGQIFFTDPPYGLTRMAKSPQREMDYMGVFRLDPDNRVTLLGKYDWPNGIGLSPDDRTLYTTDATRGWIAHALGDDGDKVSECALIDLQAEHLAPAGDGLKVDASGHLWLSGDDGIGILTPQGHRIGRIRIPNAAPNCAFGRDGNLYIANGDGIVRVPVKTTGIVID